MKWKLAHDIYSVKGKQQQIKGLSLHWYYQYIIFMKNFTEKLEKNFEIAYFNAYWDCTQSILVAQNIEIIIQLTYMHLLI